MENAPFLSLTTVLLALFPLTHLIHFAEEYFCAGGYPAYLMRLRGVHLPMAKFVGFQIFGFVFFVTTGLISYYLNFPEFMILILGGLFVCNGLSHSITAIWDRHYGPGLITSAFVWLPLGLVAIYMMFGKISNVQFMIATLIGLSINGGIAILTMRGGKIV